MFAVFALVDELYLHTKRIMGKVIARHPNEISEGVVEFTEKEIRLAFWSPRMIVADIKTGFSTVVLRLSMRTEIIPRI